MAELVAVVAGATRGCGRAIAVELGAIGATVYAAGRTTRASASPMNRPETIEDTAELVTKAGGHGIAVRCDFTVQADVADLRSRLDRLDVLVNDVWGGDPFVEHGTPFWESDVDAAIAVHRNGIETHLRALHTLLPLMVEQGKGLVVEVTDGDDETYHGVALPYYLVKSGIRRTAQAMGAQLTAHGITALALTPGYIRSEAMLEGMGVTEENWRDATAQDIHFAMAESPHHIGRAVAALARDPEVNRWSGQSLSSWSLMREYGFTDVDGTRPDWGRWFADIFGKGLDPHTVNPDDYR
ncbi:SDR family oxidoreductase [Kibdelosporangium phytohabitans]|uniref:Short-chain dehydrogenase n=1 Tax=Kibdelosporangium phytohabitans TaxID=860235 RepID=A0A0N9IFW2_9PSEU|nr:SDR family oxidoreductase [Kibdelosporangium phytohabitans]ALG14362.1 short-chain dehydrogenase [Kibdelosporangium phytohabitans]MBE1466605.1 NAD(P)-dependent dehydrogenase (short-subunit alcohol dehydrogenase family) [Kibdelosporangium phytohabitans]